MRRIDICCLLLAGLATASTAAADSTTLDAALGGAAGGAAGAAIGHELGGRDAAILGGALGAAVGTAVTTAPRADGDSGQRPRTEAVGTADRPAGRTFCPPGQAKKGRC